MAIDPGKPVVGVSSCLLGHQVRFDGGHKRDPFLSQLLASSVTWRPVCPEVEIGMGLPREPVRLVRLTGGPTHLRGTRSGTDWTAAMTEHARRRADGLAGLDGYVVKRRSPTCGMERVKVYPADGEGAPAHDGVGLFTAAVMRRWPDLPVEEEGRLRDRALRESFLQRVLVHRRLRALWGDGAWRPRDLVAFHTVHKMLVLAHHPDGYRRLGRLVAAAGVMPRPELQARYQRELMAALARPAAPGRHANTLQHLAGHLRRHLDAGDRRELAVAIDDYRRGLVPREVPLTLLRHHLRRLEAPQSGGQIYLRPLPPEAEAHG